MALKPPDMGNCNPKLRCNGVAYDPADPCPSGQVFVPADCDCTQADSGCWYLHYTASGQDVEPSSAEYETYQNVPAPGDYFGSNVIEEGDRSIGVLSNSADAYPDTGFTHTPNVKECDGTNCDLSSYYWGQVGQVQTCVTSDRAAGGNAASAPFTLGIANGAGSNNIGGYSGGFSIIRTIPGVFGDGTNHCTTASITYSRDDRFPEWATCTDPYYLWFKFTVVSGRVDNNGWIVCDDSYCSDPQINWARSPESFITFGGLTIDSFYTPSSCGYWTRNGAIITFTRTSWWDPDGNGGSNANPYRRGMVVEGSDTISRSYGTSYATDTQVKKVEVYLGPRIPWSSVTSGRVSEGATQQPGDGFTLVMAANNDSEYIAC